MEVRVEEGPVYDSGGIVYYRASSLGGCVRMLALARQGYDRVSPPANVLEMFKQGHEAEREVWSKGIVKGLAQEYVELPISETIRVSGHLDCWDYMPLADHGPINRYKTGKVYEIKSQSEAEWRPIRQSPLWQRYKFQLGVYMHATGLPLVVVRVRRGKEGGIEGEAVREEFSEPPVTIEEIRRRVFEVETLARRDLTEVNCERVEFPCPFFYTHVNGQSGESEGRREEVDDPAAVVLARQYRDARLVAEIANGRVKASREALVGYMGERSKLVLGDGTLLTRYKVGAKRVEYDRGEFWSLRVTNKKESSAREAGGEAGGDRV